VGARSPHHPSPRNPAPQGAGFVVSRAVALLAAGALAAPSAGRAGEAAVTLEVGPTLGRLDYVERDRSGRFLDGEEGWLPGVVVRGDFESGRLFVGGGVRLARGAVDYEGRTQSAAPANDDLPIASRSDADFAQVEARAGGWLDAGRQVGLYGGAAARRWGRDIRSTTVVSRTGATIAVSGLEEVYDWRELQAGVRLAAEPNAWARLEFDARLFQVLLPRVSVEWGGETVELRLGSRPGWRLGVSTFLALDDRWTVAAEAALERYRFGASDPDPSTGILEPASETTHAELSARIGARF
jgi:hypothetical protein